MIIQNSTDIKTELFYDENGDISPIDINHEKHIINPNGLVQLQNIPSPHTVFTIVRRDGVNMINYNKVDEVISQYDFKVDYLNGILTFHSSQIGMEVKVSYTNAIGRLSISADRIFTSTDNQGNIIQTLNTLIEEGQSVLSKLDTVGGASQIIQEMKGYMDSIKSLTSTIIEGANTSKQLKADIYSAKTEKANLVTETTKASEKIAEMNTWVQTNGNVVDLNNRVKTNENKLNTVNSSLEQKATKGSITGIDLSVSSDSDKIKLINLSDEVKQAMAGTTPITTSVTKGSVVTESMARKSIIYAKTDFLKTGKNIHNPEWDILGKIIETNGNIKENSLYFITKQYIDPTQTHINCNITDTGTTFCFFDIQDEFISSFTTSYNGATSYTPIPSGSNYFIATAPITKREIMQLEYGTKATTFEKFYYKIENYEVDEFLATLKHYGISKNILLGKRHDKEYYNTTTGAVEVAPTLDRFEPIKVFPNSPYTISGFTGLNIVEFDKEGNFIKYIASSSSPLTITTTSSTYLLGLVVPRGELGLQVEVGYKATSYEEPTNLITNNWEKKDYQEGQINFKVKVNKNYPSSNTSNTIIDSENIVESTCVLMLPKSYTKSGKPTNLVMICHGSSNGVSIGSWFGNNTDFLKFVQKFLDNGYAVFDCNGYEDGKSGQEHWGSNNALQAYRKAYDYIVKNYNVTNDFSIYGFSMGGLTALNYVFQNDNNVKCIALGSPVIDLKKEVWDSGNFSKVDIATSYGFTSSSTYEVEKTIGNDPAKRIINIESVPYILKQIPPLKIWHGTNDVTVPHTYSQNFVQAIKNNEGLADIRIVEGSGHEICWGVNTNVTSEVLMWINRFNN